MAGILCSAIPMVADMRALRRVPARFFGVFMSINPVFAALTGLIVLGQSLELADWLAVAAIVTANAVASAPASRRGPGQAAPVAEMVPDQVYSRPATGHPESTIATRQRRCLSRTDRVY